MPAKAESGECAAFAGSIHNNAGYS